MPRKAYNVCVRRIRANSGRKCEGQAITAAGTRRQLVRIAETTQASCKLSINEVSSAGYSSRKNKREGDLNRCNTIESSVYLASSKRRKVDFVVNEATYLLEHDFS
uniref:Uncharacterized protein n=1 Tax=Vespula pensylvanica TaxID=30213 RepID=A0A834U7L3_VESPE|nr:hypothetical protein H0235_010317 [Vespula pensylvanica]